MNASACLIDTNVWIAMTFEAHAHHRVAIEAFTSITTDCPAVFCRSTEQSFLRIATTRRVLETYGAESITNRDALAVLRSFQARSTVVYRDEPPGIVPIWHSLAERSTVSPKVWMDAYLAAFAIAGGLRMVTLDKDFKSFVAAGLDLLLLPSS